MQKDIMIDTHVLLWLVNGNTKLRESDRDIIDGVQKSGGKILISIISIWEIALLTSKNRIELGEPIEKWMQNVLLVSEFRIVNIDVRIACKSSYLDGDFHGDPADRIIVATSIILNIPLLTYDSKMLNYTAAGFVLAN